MMRVLIFGTGSTGQRVYKEIKNRVEVIGFLDNDKSRWGNLCEDGILVIGDASACKGVSFDKIFVCSLNGMEEIRQNLIDAGVSPEKVDISYVETQIKARINFLRDYASDLQISESEKYAVAEGGVFRGDFAKHINNDFPENDLYLFDTFEGFDARDIKVEKNKKLSEQPEHHLNLTSEELVLSVLPNKERAIIKKGYFPDTTIGMEEREFIFVNIDFDLYQPILEGLKYFYPRLKSGCCILIHDYFNPGYPGVKEAVDEYEKCYGKLIRLPIGDHCSIAIVKI